MNYDKPEEVCSEVINAPTPIEVNLNLEKNTEEEKADSTLFKQIVGSLRYLCNRRPDICYAKGLVSEFKEDPRSSHMNAARRIMKYLKGTLCYGVLFPKMALRITHRAIRSSDSMLF